MGAELVERVKQCEAMTRDAFAVTEELKETAERPRCEHHEMSQLDLTKGKEARTVPIQCSRSGGGQENGDNPRPPF
jgi:hypothetical protein